MLQSMTTCFMLLPLPPPLSLLQRLLPHTTFNYSKADTGLR